MTLNAQNAPIHVDGQRLFDVSKRQAACGFNESQRKFIDSWRQVHEEHTDALTCLGAIFVEMTERQLINPGNFWIFAHSFRDLLGLPVPPKFVTHVYQIPRRLDQYEKKAMNYLFCEDMCPDFLKEGQHHLMQRGLYRDGDQLRNAVIGFMIDALCLGQVHNQIEFVWLCAGR